MLVDTLLNSANLVESIPSNLAKLDDSKHKTSPISFPKHLFTKNKSMECKGKNQFITKK